jgi:phosphatidate cytidylyltransferase
VTDTRPAVQAPYEFRARVASSAVIVIAVVAAVSSWTFVFALAMAAAAVFALREWHRLVNGNLEARETIPSSAAVIAAALILLQPQISWLWALAALVAGAGLTAVSAGMRRNWVLWHGVGVLYIGIPTLALIALHAKYHAHYGWLAVGGIFAAVWAADTAAMFAGRSIGGPRLAPSLSPNKTWAGFLGGLGAATLAEPAYVGITTAYSGATVSVALLAGAALFGLFLGIAAAFGDLFESWVKRRCQAKNSGSLIPGHGGMLDRIDSLLFAAPAGAALLFMSGVDLFGSRP